MSEAAKLQVDQDQAAKSSMKQKQVDPILLVSDTKAFLASDEGEFAAKLQKKFLQVLDESVFQLALRVFVLQVQKFEHKRVTDDIRVESMELIVGNEGWDGGNSPKGEMHTAELLDTVSESLSIMSAPPRSTR